MRIDLPLWLMVFILVSCSPSGTETPEAGAILLELGLPVAPGENREYSYTDKQDAYYYGRTHAPVNDDWFSGWNVRTRRIFQDYSLLVDGQPLDRTTAQVAVYPHLLKRDYEGATERFSLFDHQRVLMVELEASAGQRAALSLIGASLQFGRYEEGVAFFRHTEYPDVVLGVAPIHEAPGGLLERDSLAYLQADMASGGFFIALDSTEAALKSLLASARRDHEQWAANRRARMEALITERNYFESSDSQLTLAIRWNTLTLDQLITRQTGYGIYAGLPWFNDYWGRDLFISLPGACLVTGQFEVARNILTDFAEYQNTDESSPNFGRVPNRLRPEDVIYNTTDGSPRFVTALLDYVRYSGDTAIIRELYPAVRRATEGVLQYWVDERGYLTHDDADTWMDARIDKPGAPTEEKLPWSPRGNRANDIQALWYAQLRASVFFANQLGEAEDAEKWKDIARQLQYHFRKDFLAAGQPLMADHLNEDGLPDFALRPNQLFAMDFLNGDSLRFAISRRVWEGLVYPWGVASLSQKHPEFHPYHENPEYHHKDAAYHNGTVWLWNNGIAMQRLLEAGQVEMSYRLFSNMSRMALEMRAVGSLSENTDALPLPGAKWPRLTGTFLQAWSNAEYLRVWYQYFIGIRPDEAGKSVAIQPRIPEQLSSCKFKERLFGGYLSGQYEKKEGQRRLHYSFEGIDAVVLFQIDTFAPRAIKVAAGDTFTVYPDAPEPYLEIKGVERLPLEPSTERAARQELADRLFSGMEFAQPKLPPGLGALSGKDWLKKKREREAGQ